ncbi:HEPN domain-containing protein [Candidatus Woesearchaeota archaeon]|nr:HEPN domain-containing protein [Candidatus Woesearchaeota archaeon]
MVYQPKYDYLSNEEELKRIVEEHQKIGSIITIKEIDYPNITLNFSKAENELKHAEAAFKISFNDSIKKELELLETDTFYSGVISHAYYAIFFAAKALLIKEKVITKSPNIHKATLDAFSCKKFRGVKPRHLWRNFCIHKNDNDRFWEPEMIVSYHACGEKQRLF